MGGIELGVLVAIINYTFLLVDISFTVGYTGCEEVKEGIDE